MSNTEINLITVELGTKLGYEDYKGEFYDDKNNLIADWRYDKRQKKYIAHFISDKLEKGYKNFYANSVSQLQYQIKNFITKLT